MFNNEIRKYYDDMYGRNGFGDAASVVQSIPLVGQQLGATLSAISGLIQRKKAKQLLAQNPYPTESIPAEELANQQAAQNMANEGMPSAQYEQAKKNIQRQQATAIFGSQDRRMGGSIIPAIQEETNNAEGNLDAESAAIRRQNQLNLQTVNSRVANYRQQAFDWNQKQKYLQNYQYGMSLLGQGNANAFSGADKLIGGLTQGTASGLFSSGGQPSVSYGGSAKLDSSLPGIGIANTSSGAGSPAGLFSTISTVAPLIGI